MGEIGASITPHPDCHSAVTPAIYAYYVSACAVCSDRARQPGNLPVVPVSLDDWGKKFAAQVLADQRTHAADAQRVDGLREIQRRVHEQAQAAIRAADVHFGPYLRRP